jgi:undecaprenyl diphosphate synthase
MVLNIALNYGGRAEIARAAQKIAQQVRQGALSIDEIGEKTIADNLDTAGQPDVDLLVRTGGENRLSGFLLYQCSYAELFVQQTLWPDFSMQELQAILHSYSVRERRYGNIPAQEVP